MEINSELLEDGDIVYGCAFNIDFDRSTCVRDKIVHNKCKPVKGIIKKAYPFYKSEFIEYGKNGNLKKSSSVRIGSRSYTKTYHECVELYNSIIEEKQQKFKSIIEEIEKEKI